MRPQSSTLKFVLLSALLLGAGTGQAVWAHHSYAMFDRAKEDTFDAIVRTWEFTSPHATLWVYVNDANGTPQLWGLEAPGPNQLVRVGWDKDTVRPGDKVKAVINPLRDGRKGGSLVKLILADGRSMDVAAPQIPGTSGKL